MDAEDVVVSREHVEGGRVVEGVGHNLDLRVIDAREVAGTGGLMLFGLERERVRVDTGVGAASVVVVGLHLVEVLTLLFLETVLAVKNKLEVGEGTNGIFGEDGITTDNVTEAELGRTVGGGRHKDVGAGPDDGGGLHLDIAIRGRSGEVPHGVLRLGVGEAPHKLLNGVVVGEARIHI